MNKIDERETFVKAFDMIDDRFIEEGMEDIERRKSFPVTAAVSAVAAAAIIGGAAYTMNQPKSVADPGAQADKNGYSLDIAQSEDDGKENKAADHDAIMAYSEIQRAVSAAQGQYPDNYAGMYVDKDTVHLMLTDVSGSEYYLGLAGDYSDRVVIEKADRSYNELAELMNNTITTLGQGVKCEQLFCPKLNTVQINIKNDVKPQEKLSLSYDETLGAFVTNDGVIIYLDTEEDDFDDSVDYDVDMKSDEYYNMSYEERVEAFNIDPERLKNASTDRVLELAVSYPLGVNLMMFDDYADGLEDMIKRSTVFQELIVRGDMKEAALKRYAGYTSEYAPEQQWMQRMILEALIEYKVWDKMTDDEKKYLTEIHDAIGTSEEYKTDLLGVLIIPYRDGVISGRSAEDAARKAVSEKFNGEYGLNISLMDGAVVTYDGSQSAYTVLITGKDAGNTYIAFSVTVDAEEGSVLSAVMG